MCWGAVADVVQRRQGLAGPDGVGAWAGLGLESQSYAGELSNRVGSIGLSWALGSAETSIKQGHVGYVCRDM